MVYSIRYQRYSVMKEFNGYTTIKTGTGQGQGSRVRVGVGVLCFEEIMNIINK
jgi:hypothetical protein